MVENTSRKKNIFVLNAKQVYPAMTRKMNIHAVKR